MNVAIADAVSRGGQITLDLTDLMFMDSSGVGAIIGSVKTLPTG
jgi:anti-anti-sigma factor